MPDRLDAAAVARRTSFDEFHRARPRAGAKASIAAEQKTALPPPPEPGPKPKQRSSVPHNDKRKKMMKF